MNRTERSPTPLLKVEDIAYVEFEKPDLDATERFLADFGLITVSRTEATLHARARGTAPFCYVARRGSRARFVGIGLAVASADDLERASRIAGASSVEPASGPGGGHRVRLRAPNGMAVDLVHGAVAASPIQIDAALPTNAPDHKPRVNSPRRPAVTPAEVMRLGHVAIRTPHFGATLDWLLESFGMIVSDYEVLAGDEPVVAFVRCDRGERPADHHTLALICAPTEGFEHAAFEVPDLDAVAIGGERLERAGWRRVWGIGRHLLGSQIFDYWRDPDGMMVEHFADGDVFDATMPTGTIALSRSAQAQWGPEVPDDFLDASITPSRIVQAMRALRGSSDLSVRKLVAIKRALSR